MSSSGLSEADQERLRSLWCSALELDGDCPPDATFIELGGYSLLALSLADTIGAEFGLPVPRTVIFEQPTLTKLSAWLGEVTAPEPGGEPAAPLADGAGGGDGSVPMSALQQAYLLGETGGFDLACPAVVVEEYDAAEFDLARFRAALDGLVQRHPMLRSAFSPAGRQEVVAAPDRPLVEFAELSGSTPAEIESELDAGRDGLTCDVPAPDSGTVLRFRVWRLPAGYRIQMWGRLLVLDGTSLDIIVDELHALLAGQVLPDLDYTFGDYQRDLGRHQDAAHREADRQYWTDRLASLPPAPALPYRRRDIGAERHQLTRRHFQLDRPAWQAFKAAAAAHGLTATMALCAAFCEVLRHYASSRDFTINVMYGERHPVHPDAERLVGNFSDTLLLECAAGTAHTFAGRAKALGEQLVADLAHSTHSGVDTIRALNSSRGGTQGAAMPVVFASVVGGGSREGIFFEGLGWTRLGGAIHTPQVSLDHQVFEARGGLLANWDTVDEMFPPGLIDEMFTSYRTLLDRLCTDPVCWHEPAVLRTPAAALAVRAAVNDTAAPIAPRTLHEPFFARAAQTPDAVALVTDDSVLTYRELAGRAALVAADLRAAGCQPGELVLVHEDRGPSQVVAVLGVLAAGGIYVPLGPGWPAARITRVVERSKATYLVTGHDAELPWAAGLRRAVVSASGSAAVQLAAVDSDALAYVIFTSGTTGEPKGVMISHDSAANTIDDLVERFDIGPADRVLAISELTFDLSVFDLFAPLGVGAAVVVPDAMQARDMAALHDLCAAAGVTIWNSVPAYLGMLVDYRETTTRAELPALRLAMVSGDWVPVALGGRLAATLPHVRLVSLGGATEASVWSNWFPVPDPVPADWSSIPYGYPLANQHFRVLDDSMSDRPDWVSGDLYIGGRGVAAGYLNDAGLTAATFVEHPADGTRLYRTGDRACYWPDGTLEFLGRLDGQVKVNGFRVEVGEVEAALLAEPGVRDAAVVLRRDDRGGSLVGHVVLTGTRAESEILGALGHRLPDYLVPRRLVAHDVLPLTGNGKVDRDALARRVADGPLGAGSAGSVGAEPVPPAGAAEQTMLRLWRAVVPVAGVTDDFFAAGGHSLAAAGLMNTLEREFGVRLPLAQLYRHPTVRELAGLLGQQAASGPSLVHLGGSAELLVLVHPVGGDVLCYLPLVAELADSFAVYGISAVPASSDEREVTELAEQYLRLVGDTVPDAPLGIVGWSFGAVVGYEMARLARDQGRPCEVVMLDPWLPPRPGIHASEPQLERAFAHDISAGRRDDVEGLDIDAETLADLYGRYRSNATALLRYQFDADEKLGPTIVTAQDGFGTDRPNDLVPLRSVVGESMLPRARWRSLAGNHFSVVDPQRSAEVAGLVREGLRGDSDD